MSERPGFLGLPRLPEDLRKFSKDVAKIGALGLAGAAVVIAL